MANTLGQLSGALIVQRSLELLKNQYPALALISTDFQNQAASFNQAITSRIIGVGAAQDYTCANGFVASDATSTDVTVTIDKFKYSAVEFCPTEVAATSRNLLEDYAGKIASELGDAVYKEIAALFTAVNYPNSIVQDVATANRVNTIVKANTALNKRNVNKNRFGLYNSDLYGQLWADDSLVKLTYDADGIGATALPRVHGVTLAEYSSLPAAGNLIGVQGAKDGLVIATRIPTDVAALFNIPTTARIENATDPDTGLTIQFRAFVNDKTGSVTLAAGLMFGVAVGNNKSIQRIISAAVV